MSVLTPAIAFHLDHRPAGWHHTTMQRSRAVITP
jgi:hypothetical protein